MRVLWICGLPNEVRLNACDRVLSSTPTAAWSWIMGHLPPPHGIEMHLLCPVVGLNAAQVDFEYLGAHWHCFRRKSARNIIFFIRYVMKVRRFIKRLNADIIHGWGGETGFGFAATLFSKNAIVSVQGLLQLLLYCNASKQFIAKYQSIAGKWAIFRENETYRRAKVLLVESEASKKGLAQYYGKDGIFIPHPLRNEFLDFDIADRLKLASEEIKFVFVGSFVCWKGTLDAIKAFEPYAKHGAKLIYIGSGLQQDDLERFIKDHELTDSVMIYNALSAKQIVEKFSDAQFFLLPSYGDTGPTALKEALACGLYPICYDNSGPKDLIGRYGCGKLVETGNVDALKMVIGLCIKEIKPCVIAGLAAAKIVRHELSREFVWRRLEDIYKRVMV